MGTYAHFTGDRHLGGGILGAGARGWVRLHDRGGNENEIPTHRTLNRSLEQYSAAACIACCPAGYQRGCRSPLHCPAGWRDNRSRLRTDVGVARVSDLDTFADAEHSKTPGIDMTSEQLIVQQHRRLVQRFIGHLKGSPVAGDREPRS